MNPIISLHNVSVVYNLGKSSETRALLDVNCEIYPEEYVIFFGPSGCGKSTLLYTIAGLETPTEGKVIVGDKDLTLFAENDLIRYHQQEVGMIFQAFYLVPSLTIERNILLPQLFMGNPGSVGIQDANRLMRRFGIQDLAKKYPNALSGGQQQRVAVARALVNRPRIVLADEPVGNLDSRNADIVLDMLTDLNKRDRKVVIHVTHNAQHLHKANRVFFMEDGRIVRVSTNPKRHMPGGIPVKGVSPLDRLAQLYPHLSESRLKSKLVLNHVLLSYTIEEQEKIEALIEMFIKGELSEFDLKEALDLPPERGGVNLYEQTARSLTSSIASLVREMELVGEGRYGPAPAEERAIELRGYLLDKYPGALSLQQVRRMEEFLARRIIGKVTNRQLEELLDRPFTEGGVGLNRRTARRFAREVRTLLVNRQSL